MKTIAAKFIGLANLLSLDADGWALIPYGDSKHNGEDGKLANAPEKGEKPVIQRFRREDADEMVEHFSTGLGRIKRAFVGPPVYKGHPDAPRFANLFRDKSPRGMIADMKARDDGLALKVVLTDQGASEVEGGCNEFSPFWGARIVEDTGDRRIVAPCQLYSIGIVPKGNMHGLSLTNAAPDENFSATQTTMNKKLLELLQRLGLTVAADAGEAALANALDQGLTALNTTTTALANANTELATVKAKVTTLESEKLALANSAATATNLTTDLANARTALAAERKERVLLLVNAAFTEGRLPATERDATITALCNAADFSAEAAKLAARTKVVQTTSKADELARQQRQTSGSKSQQVLDLVNARMASHKENYDAAYANVMLTPEYAAIYPKAEAKAKG